MAYRSTWKPFYFDLRNKIFFFQTMDINVSRNSIIPFGFIDGKFLVYNGKRYIVINVTNKHINLKFGEFACSRSLYAKGNLNLKKKKKKIKSKK
jgi:ribosomal protein S19